MTQQAGINGHPELHPWRYIGLTGEGLDNNVLWCPHCGAFTVKADEDYGSVKFPEIAMEPKYLEVPMDGGKGE